MDENTHTRNLLLLLLFNCAVFWVRQNLPYLNPWAGEQLQQIMSVVNLDLPSATPTKVSKIDGRDRMMPMILIQS